MKTFGAWLWEKQNTDDPDLRALAQLANQLAGNWPMSSADRSDYQLAIEAWADPGRQEALLQSLDRAWKTFGKNSRGLRQTSAGDSIVMPIIGTIGVVGILSATLYWTLSIAFLERLSKLEMARGLITFLFSMTTVGIFLMIIIATFTSNLDDHRLTQRFQHGKDVLTLLIGILGTIVGFYFGQATSARDSAGPQKTATAETPSASAQAEADLPRLDAGQIEAPQSVLSQAQPAPRPQVQANLPGISTIKGNVAPRNGDRAQHTR